MSQDKVTLYYLDQSRAFRILWLLEELGVEYELREYKRTASYLAPDEARRAVHPLGHFPVLEHGGLKLAESGVIIEYLLDTFDTENRFTATGKDKYLASFWNHFSEGSLMPLLVMKLVLTAVAGRVPFLIRPVASMIVSGIEKGYLSGNISRIVAFVESELAGKSYFVADRLTAADIAMSFPLEAGRSRVGLTEEQNPNIIRFLKTIHERPAFKRALERDPSYKKTLGEA